MPSYRNWGVLLFQEAGVKGVQNEVQSGTGNLRIDRGLIGDLVNYKLKFSYLSVLAYIWKGNGDEWRSK